MARHVVAAADEIPPGGRKRVEVEGRPIAVFNVNGELFALADRCPHQGASLCQGKLVGLVEAAAPGQYRYSRRGEIIRCPWHGWEYDLRTGRSWCEPERARVRNFPVTIEPGRTLMEGPYVAETFPVRIEDDYVVITTAAAAPPKPA
jgi:3-phenylpropionate/trans-cinnamate dioxygenase ferredoxin subunit